MTECSCDSNMLYLMLGFFMGSLVAGIFLGMFLRDMMKVPSQSYVDMNEIRKMERAL